MRAPQGGMAGLRQRGQGRNVTHAVPGGVLLERGVDRPPGLRVC
jgi:hypothetical protein